MAFTEQNVAVLCTCRMCKKELPLFLSLTGLMAWRNGALIQDALPELTVNEHEQLMSGMCPTCWNATFSTPTEEAQYDER